MKKNGFLSLFFAFCLLGTMGSAPVYGADNQDVSGPVAVVPGSEFDFGTVLEGNEVLHDFIVRNTGSQDLIIKNVKTG